MTCEPRSPLTTTCWPRPALWPPNEACLSAPSSRISPAAASPLTSPPPPAMASASSPYGPTPVPLPPIWSRPWAMGRRPLPIFRGTRRIAVVRGQRHVVRVRWIVVLLRCSVVRGAFPLYADNGELYTDDEPSSPYDAPSYAGEFLSYADNGALYAYDGPSS